MIANLASTAHLKPQLLMGAMIRLGSVKRLSNWLMILMEKSRIEQTGGKIELWLSHKAIVDRTLPREVECEVTHRGGT